MRIQAHEIVKLVDLALEEYAKKYKTPIVNISYDGDHKSCEVIIDVEEPGRDTKSVARQSFVISSSLVVEIPYKDSDTTEAG